MPLMCDFETVISPESTRVWLWAIYDIDTNGFLYGNDIDSFFEFMKTNVDTYYFHNLKFDGEFLIHYLLTNGFEYNPDRRIKPGQFTAIIADTGQWYSLSIKFGKNGIIKIYDSLKILPFSVDVISKSFGLENKKGSIDYIKEREEGYIPTKDEIEYIYNDVAIVAKALKVLFEQGLTKMTQASNALFDYKNTLPKSAYKYWYPTLAEDEYLRKAYKGGFTYLNPKYANIEIRDGIVLDVNSLYPSVMYNELMPYGTPIRYEGKYEKDDMYPLYIQYFSCAFELKEGHIPTLQIKHSAYFAQNEYVTSSGGRDYALCMTSVDLALFLEHYEIYNVEWRFGYKFKGCYGMFTSYIDKWTKIKIDADKEGNNGMRTLAKLMLNALYGRFGLNPNCTRKIPYIDEGVVRYAKGEKETRNPIYVPIAAFITAYARYKTISSAQKLYDRFIYADTDSLHLIGTDLPDLDIDDTKMGAWKHESTFDRAKFIRQKTYIEHWTMHKNKKVDENNITCAGLPKTCSYTYRIAEGKYRHKGGSIAKVLQVRRINFNTFEKGMKVFGKLMPKHVVGGVILKEGVFTLW